MFPTEDHESRGIDWDLWACLEYNPQKYKVDDIDRVLAVYEGENDGPNWRWILALKDGSYEFLEGGCDYTGWDCQSWAKSVLVRRPEDAIAAAYAGDSWDGRAADAAISLARQLAEGKDETWREQQDPIMRALIGDVSILEGE